MATCTALTAITKSCSNNLGGISNIWIYDSEDVTITAASGTVSAIVLATGQAGQKFAFNRNTGSFTEEFASDLVNGSGFYTQTINLMFHKREAAKSQALNILAEGQRDLMAIVEDANGTYWVFNLLQLTAIGEGSGQAKADGSKYSATLVAESEDPANDVAYATLQTFDSTLFA